MPLTIISTSFKTPIKSLKQSLIVTKTVSLIVTIAVSLIVTITVSLIVTYNISVRTYEVPPVFF